MKKFKSGFKHYKDIQERYDSFIKEAKISKGSKELLEAWIAERRSNKFKDLSNIGLLGTIINIAQAAKIDLTKQDNKKALQDFFNNNAFKDSQELWYKKCLKRFYTWLSNYSDEPRYLININWINTQQLSARCSEAAHKHREDNLLAPEDVRKMISKAVLLRDKLAIALLADAGIRAESIGASKNNRSINVGQIEIKKGYAIIKDIEEKFSKKRNVIVTEALSYLIKYWNELPEDHKKEHKNPLFLNYSTNRYGKRWGYSGLKDMLHKVSRLALDRVVNPHDFRHLKATRLHLDDNLSDDAKCKLMGWNSRRMLDRYNHTTFDDAKAEYLEKKGIIKIDPKDKKKKIEAAILQPKQCLICKHVNSDTDKICENCGNTLDYERIIKKFTEQEKAEEELKDFLKPGQMQELFKLYYKLQKIIDKAKQ